ncbi:hypothetical protein BH23PLA1_BH23PLA1_26690 [soil metagenome]
MHTLLVMMYSFAISGNPGTGSSPDIVSNEWIFNHENVMGTALELRVRAEDQNAARWAEARVLETIDRLSAVFSNHDPTSEFRRWQASPRKPLNVSEELFELLQKADDWRLRSGGAFDPRAEALTRIWSATAAHDRTPTADELDRTLTLLRPGAWRLDPEARTAERRTECPLSLDAIAKGYIIEQACQAAMVEEHGIRGLLLNVGGDLRAIGEAPWTIGLAPALGDSESAEPFAQIEIKERALATSGNAHRGFQISGRWYSHIFDPRTGQPVEPILQAAVIAPRSADADVLATIFNILSVEESLRLARALPDVECQIVTSDGRVQSSEGWQRFETPEASELALQAEKAKPALDSGEIPWGEEFELVIEFEINRPEVAAGRYRRPYVIVYVEDEHGEIVRHLVVWISIAGSGPEQWLPDVRRWYRSGTNPDPIEKRNTANVLGRPTRPPGEYIVVWDGNDDRKQPLPPGEYTVFIEAAREHGTHQIIRKPVNLRDQPFVETLEGGVEIQSATIEYRRKPL